MLLKKNSVNIGNVKKGAKEAQNFFPWKKESVGREVIEMHSALKSSITISMTIWEMLHVFSFPQNHYTDANRQNYFF